MTQLAKVHFITVNELKLTQGEVLSFSYFMYVAGVASALFYMAHLANNDRFLYHSNLPC